MKQNTKKINNSLCICVYIICLISIALLNYIADPYRVFNHKKKISTSTMIVDYPFVSIKLHKKYKYQYVSPGGSTGKHIEIDSFNNDIANIAYEFMTIENMKNLLFNFLNEHKEVKYALIQLDYSLINKKNNEKLPKYTGKNLNLREIHKLFFSLKTTKESIEQIFTKNKEIGYTVKTKGPYKSNIENKEEYIKRADLFYSEIFTELKKRNIEIICYTLPISAFAQLDFYNQHGDAIFKLKKMIVEKNGYLIDFAIVNKYTSMNLNNAFYLYYDAIHPRRTLGYYVFSAIFNTPDKDENLYIILTKNNVDSELKKQEEELIKWADKHKQEYKDYLDKTKEPKTVTKTLDDFPLEFKNIMTTHKRYNLAPSSNF